MTQDIILQTESLTRDFNGFRAVDSVSLSVRRGHIHAIIGPNGAGKTTFFNLLTNFIRPSAGKVMYEGVNITARSSADIANLGIVRSFQISAVFPHLTLLQNIRIALQKRAGKGLNFWSSKRILNQFDDQAMQILALVRLESLHDKLAVEIAYGQKRALELATTIALDPKLVLLDEPTQGMGHEDVEHIMELVRQVAQNRTVVMVEHNMKVVAGISDQITVLARGKELASGTYSDVSRNEAVIEAYMGRKRKRNIGTAHDNA
ncbi:ABC transporter ATP-binding protein [Orrella marina]|uniref:ABC transporter ATP-binding protein n=1 Tax=Orrella marina TaxID=2163011 RepID=A0A2R4XG35_9BURK|nr:ABC transporter ATP-binding protein [Orrella marina]AWB32780.1 ABC transporter ATP-binding protein [Orrella marina]